MIPDLCIFDLDGIIVNTAKYHYLAWKKLAEKLNFDFTEKDNEDLKGVSRKDSLEILLNYGYKRGLKKHFSEDEKNRMMEEKNKIYIDYIDKMDKNEILPGVTEYFLILKKNKIKIALGSASKNSLKILEKLAIKDYFDVIIDGNKVKKAKPDPEVFETAAKQLNVKNQECVVFEDSKSGIEAAKKCGMKSVGVGNPYVLKAADKVINGFINADINLINF